MRFRITFSSHFLLHFILQAEREALKKRKSSKRDVKGAFYFYNPSLLCAKFSLGLGFFLNSIDDLYIQSVFPVFFFHSDFS